MFSKNFDSKHEAKHCPRCQRQFICKANRIHRCDCSNVRLSPETSEHIWQLYDECLCQICLSELETIVTPLKSHQLWQSLG
ncbi:cysteine-rich CWC family protein [Methylomonas rapida]|uniref:Cysteine-rich CWC family protein n=1 Tax=Methylomonas rapida TaxID=2963939 RepID=A0ABY7GN99_9GAMM|nr:cysteine-rich CWC family protein [Methylomonas rapida]WAR45965.1 cysteine-rich CWC family protein [Methylomonas rapida]